MSSIAIIIPCYNEELRFPKTEFIDFINKSGNEIVFCLVNDGSKDNTLALLNALEKQFPSKVISLNIPQNQGKAEAVRAGLLIMHQHEKDFDYFAYLDADFASPPSEIILIFNQLLKNPLLLFGMGARWQRLGSNIVRKISRHYLGRIFATMASLVLKLKVYDTQCGAKVIHKSLIPVVCKDKFLRKWLFDVELIARIIQEYGKDKTEKIIIEVPLNIWIEKGGSKLKLKDLLFVPLELLKIRRIYFKTIKS